jgi:hypothetical protein
MNKDNVSLPTPARFRWLFLLSLLASLLALGFAAEAEASTISGHQNPNLALTLSVSPNSATTGQVVTAVETVTNTSSTTRTVNLVGTLTTPDRRSMSRSLTVALKPGQTSRQSQTYTVASSDERGLYTLRIDASNLHRTSSGSASVNVV